MPGALRLGTFAAVHPGKGQEDVVRAVADLTATGVDVELLLAGGHHHPDYKHHLEDIVRTHRLEGRVNLAGELANPYPAMRAVDIIVVCSRAEAYGRVGVEAMLLGKPVIYPDRGGMSEYMVEGKTGYGYRPGHIDELVDQVRKLCDPQARAAMGEFGRRHAATLCSKEEFSGEVYRALLSLRGCAPQRSTIPASIEPYVSEASAVPISLTRDISRNAPCPCGSGKRFKHCHGRIN